MCDFVFEKKVTLRPLVAPSLAAQTAFFLLHWDFFSGPNVKEKKRSGLRD